MDQSGIASIETGRIRRYSQQLELRARRILAGPSSGGWSSRWRGRGPTFEELRPYQPGDDVRDVSWAATARRGEPVVKRFVEERDRTIWLMFDDSPSMRFGNGGAIEGGLWYGQAKRRTAFEAAALVAFACTYRRDRVGLQPTSIQARVLPAKTGTRQASRILRELLEPQPGDEQRPFSDCIRRICRSAKRKSMVVAVSDFLDASLAPALLSIAGRHEVVAIRVVDPWERELPRLGLIRWRDAESGDVRLIDTSNEAFRRRYAERALERQESLVRVLGRSGIKTITLDTTDDAMTALARAWSS